MAAFAGMHIGGERIGDELGADSLTGIVATALAVTTNTITSPRSGLPFPLRAPVSAARGVMLALYALVRGVTLRQPGLSALLVLALAVAGMLVGFRLYGSAQAAGRRPGQAGRAALVAGRDRRGVHHRRDRDGGAARRLVGHRDRAGAPGLLPGAAADTVAGRSPHADLRPPAPRLSGDHAGRLVRGALRVLSLVQRFGWRAYARTGRRSIRPAS